MVPEEFAIDCTTNSLALEILGILVQLLRDPRSQQKVFILIRTKFSFVNRGSYLSVNSSSVGTSLANSKVGVV